VKWVAPTELYVDLGFEAGRGRAFPGTDRGRNGLGSGTVFAHLGGDIGESYAWQVGLSHLRTSPQDRTYDDLDASGAGVTNSFTGRSRLLALDGILKWAPEGNSTETNFKLQGEYFRFTQDGTLTYNDAAGSGRFGSVTGPLNATQTGWYGQGVWQFAPTWRIGYRYDRLNYGSLNNGIVTSGIGPGAADFPLLWSHSPTRNTVMLDWNPTEFSRLRLQLAQDKSRLGLTDNQVLLQYVYSLGAHGAHKF
jgi:hypothetical protein